MTYGWIDELRYERLGERYAAPWAHPYVSRFDTLLRKACEPTQDRAIFQADYAAYKQQLDADGAPVATRGTAHVMQQNLLAMLKSVKKLRPTQVQRKAANMHGKFYDAHFAPVLLRFDEPRLMVSTPSLDGDTYTWVSLPMFCGARVEQPFAVLVDFATLFNLVKLLNEERIDLRYRWLVGKLEIRQWNSRTNLVCIPPGEVPGAESVMG